MCVRWRCVRARRVGVAGALALLIAGAAHADPSAIPADQRLVAVHGRRALVVGYPEAGLEVWAYPLQVLSGYRLRFHEAGRVEPWDGQALLRRVETGPSETVRVYVGPDFVVRERLFTPLDAPAAFVDFEVEGRPGAVQIEARFTPSLNLMWPGALGGQTVGWDAARSAYVEREPLHGYSASVGSAQAVEHDATTNLARGRADELALVLKPRVDADRVGRATLRIDAAVATGDSAAPSQADEDALRSQAAAAYAAAAQDSLRITTPDPAFNRALVDAALALEQAWVCAPRIGCGEVAGYGPSRPGRRPQYAWFFAGDGMVAADAMLAKGRYARARDELAFVTRFQDHASGMIWHEMSLSAPDIDWARYPYMYVHVDITLQYLGEVSRYVAVTGDTAFVVEHWTELAAAWRYARSLLNPNTGLPEIPPGKEGQNEQAQLRDDVRLSSAWIEAADGFARLAKAGGHGPLAAEPRALAARARRQVAASGWDAGRGFWVEGHTRAGGAVVEDRSDAVGLLSQGVFDPAQVGTALDRLSSPAFRTDWGERSLSSSSAAYDPNAYSQGAVWGLGTSATADAFWREHRPLVGWSLLRGMAAWNTLDSPGHLPEVLAGDLYHPEAESTPEQTWSSAGLLIGAVQGLLGIRVEGATQRLSLAPHLPGDWTWTNIDTLRVGASRLRLRLREDADALILEVDNDGTPVSVDFAPEIPLGARLLSATVDGRPQPVTTEVHPQDQHARLSFTAAKGATRVLIRYTGGVRLAQEIASPRIGEASRDLQVQAVGFADGRLDVRAATADPAHATLELSTRLKATGVSGGVLAPGAEPGCLRLTLSRGAEQPGGYAPANAVVTFGPDVQPAPAGGGESGCHASPRS